MKNKVLFAIIMIIYILTPILIFFNNNFYNIKFYILTSLGIIIYFIFKLFKVNNKDLGINKNIIISLKRNIPLILIFVVLILVSRILGINKYNPDETLLFYIFYIFISCPIQEFLYRGVFGFFEKKNKHKYLWVVLSSLCYSFVHIIYKDMLTCILTFTMGVIWYLLYRKDYNLSGVCLSHIVLGILTISLGIVN